MTNEKKSKLRTVADSVSRTAASLALREIDRKRLGAKRLYKSLKISLGLLVSLLILLVASAIVLLISGLVWLSQNTALTDNAAIFLSGAVIGYIISILVTIIYVKYITSSRR